MLNHTKHSTPRELGTRKYYALIFFKCREDKVGNFQENF